METQLLAGIAGALDALAAAGGQQRPEALSPGELVAVNAAFGALKRAVDAAFAPVAAEIARQSRTELGKDSLAKRQGFRSPVSMIQATTGSSVGEAVKLVQVGEATAPRMSLTGQALPAKHPAVAEAVSAGRLSVTAAAAIVSLLDRVACRAVPDELAAAEAQLAELAPGLRADELSQLLAHAEARLDPDGIEPRFDEARAQRSLVIQERGTMVHLTGQFDAATAAPIITAIDAIVTQVLRRNEHADDATRDQRSVRQMKADALADLCRHALGCHTVPTGPTATVVVRMDLTDLTHLTGLTGTADAGGTIGATGATGATGVATIDGLHTPLPASAVRRLAADLQVIPCVLGGDSEILDWGRAKRLFTPAQKLALAERDDGCARCGAPASWTHAHHVKWWDRDRGPTDLDNGVLLCTACHHDIHDDGWEIRIDGTGITATVWFIPPPWIDATRTPRPSARTRRTLTI